MFPLMTILQECLFFLGYITGRSEFPKQLPRAEEEALIARMADGDDEARQALITHNLRLVSHIARKYTVPGFGPDDLISIGVVGLIKAVGSFKPQSGTSLGTYAARCIENAIRTPQRQMGSGGLCRRCRGLLGDGEDGGWTSPVCAAGGMHGEGESELRENKTKTAYS